METSAALTSFQGRTRTVAEWMEIRSIPEIFTRYGDWAITEFGLECLTLPYDIAASRLWEKDGSPRDWPKHMSEKRWIILSDFKSALDAARESHG